jgi:hypothetical protein
MKKDNNITFASLIMMLVMLSSSCSTKDDLVELCGDRVVILLSPEWKEEGKTRPFGQDSEFKPLSRVFRKDSVAKIEVILRVKKYEGNPYHSSKLLYSTIEHSIMSLYYPEKMQKFAHDTVLVFNNREFAIIEGVFFDDLNERFIYQLES